MKLLPGLWIVVILALSLGPLSACGGDDPEGEVNFIEPNGGAEVVSPFTVRMGTEKVIVEPAGEVRDDYGHHHIMIDTDLRLWSSRSLLTSSTAISVEAKRRPFWTWHPASTP